jgi:hypothetical protein
MKVRCHDIIYGGRDKHLIRFCENCYVRCLQTEESPKKFLMIISCRE